MQNNRLLRRKLMLLPLIMLLSACASKPVVLPLEPVSAPAIPALPSQAMQPDSPQWCSPSCSAGLMRERENWQERMTELEHPVWPAKEPTTP